MNKKILQKTKKALKKVVRKAFPDESYYRNAKRYKENVIRDYAWNEPEHIVKMYAMGSIACRPDSAGLKELLKPADLCFAHMKAYDPELAAGLKAAGVTGLCVSGNPDEGSAPAEVVYEGTWKTFAAKGITVALVHYRAPGSPEELTELVAAAGKNARYVYVYISYDSWTEEVASLMETKLDGTVQVLGVSDSQPLPQCAPKRSGTVLHAMGSIVREEGNHGFVVLETVLKDIGDTLRLLSRDYIPCVMDGSTGSVRELTHPSGEDRKIYARLDDGMLDIPARDRLMTVGGIFEILGLKMPGKYAYLQDVLVKKICSFHANDFENQCVYFLREPNILDEEPEDEYYKKLIHKLKKHYDKHKHKQLLFVFSPIALPSYIPHVKVDSSLSMHAKLVKHMIDDCGFDLKVAVTGSTGKTSTKEMLGAALSEHFNVYKNNGNENLQVRMTLTLQELSPKYDVFIQEVGGGMNGRASSFSKILTPDIGIVTNIGFSHLRFAKTREQLTINKLGIADGIRNNGPLLINMDNDMLQKADLSGKNVITYGIDSENVDYRAEKLVQANNKVTFEIVHDGNRYPCVINTPGRHNAYNALVAFCIGRRAGMPAEKIIAGIAKYKPEGIRQTLLDVSGYHLFVDCFNAAPDSMVSAVNTLSQMGDGAGKKIAVLADMTGLDELSEQMHREVGEKISKFDFDYLICYGNDIRYAYEAFSNEKVTKFFFEDKEDVISTLKQIMHPGDCVAFKGSSKFKLEENIVDEVFGTNLGTLAQERSLANKYKKGRITYQLFAGSAHVLGGLDRPFLSLNNAVKSAPGAGLSQVVSVSADAFANKTNLVLVKLPTMLRNIQTGAFQGCTSLAFVKFPETLQILEDGVFRDCSALKQVDVNRNLNHIGAEAFKGCVSLKEITLPDSVTFIGRDAFAGCDSLTVVCSEGSYADTYAKENGISVRRL